MTESLRLEVEDGRFPVRRLRVLRAGFPAWHFVVAALAFSAVCKMVSKLETSSSVPVVYFLQ
jgi:hypothetical protein